MDRQQFQNQCKQYGISAKVVEAAGKKMINIDMGKGRIGSLPIPEDCPEQYAMSFFLCGVERKAATK